MDWGNAGEWAAVVVVVAGGTAAWLRARRAARVADHQPWSLVPVAQHQYELTNDSDKVTLGVHLDMSKFWIVNPTELGDIDPHASRVFSARHAWGGANSPGLMVTWHRPGETEARTWTEELGS